MFSTESGRFWAKDGTQLTIGYSGTAEGRNNPSLEDKPNLGPIPRGVYTIGPVYTHELLGPLVMDLIPEPDTKTFGRSLFRIHGNNLENDASHGCVILNKQTRFLVSQSSDHELRVV